MANVQRVAQGFCNEGTPYDLIASKDAGVIEQLKLLATPRLSNYDEMRHGVREAIQS